VAGPTVDASIACPAIATYDKSVRIIAKTFDMLSIKLM
jgi:hypothetical protein